MITLEFLITALVVVLIPGTGVIYTVSCGLFLGARAAVAAAIGCTVGIVPALVATILGLAVIFHTSAVAFQVVKYAGVAYLLYMAWCMWRSSQSLSIQEGENQGLLSTAIRGFLLNILNPKLSIFFLAFIPQFVPAQAPEPTLNMLVLGGVFMLMTFIVFVIYGFLAHSVRTYLANSERVSTYIQRVFSGSFALLGLKLAFTDRQ